MEIERQHRRTPKTSDLFICFTSKLIHSSSMKLSSRSILSPSRHHHHASSSSSSAVLTTSLSRRLRRSGSLRGGSHSPALFPSTTTKKARGSSAFADNNPEPSSPKVTCIGQVRVKSRKKGKKIKLRACGSRRVVHAPPLSAEGSGGGDGGGAQRWVHLPSSICETIKYLGSEVSCLLPCKSSCFSGNNTNNINNNNNNGEVEERESGRCGGVFRWLVSLQEGGDEVEEREGKRRRDVELVLGGDDEVEVEERERGKVVVMERECSRRRSIFDDMEFDDLFNDGTGNVGRRSIDGGVSGGGGGCVPPKNALLLMRCRSDPRRMASLSQKFLETSLGECCGDGVEVVKEVDGIRVCEEPEAIEESVKLGEEIDENCEGLEVGSEELVQKIEGIDECGELEPKIEGIDECGELEPKIEEKLDEVGEEMVELEEEVEENSVKLDEEMVELEENIEESVKMDEEIVELEEKIELCVKLDEEMDELEEKIEVVEVVSVELDEEIDEPEQRLDDMEVDCEDSEGDEDEAEIQEEVEEMRVEEEEMEEEEEKSGSENRDTTEDDQRIEVCELKENSDETEVEQSVEVLPNVEEMVEEIGHEDGFVERDESYELFTNSSSSCTSSEVSKELDPTQEEEEEEEEVEEGIVAEVGRKSVENEKKNSKLPDCLLMMMWEPKLSMEVSKETWVSSTDFTRWLPERYRNKKSNKIDSQDDQPSGTTSSTNKKAKPAAVVAQPRPPPAVQKGRSSISFPTGGGSVANFIEQKLAKVGVEYEPLVLPRCKSAPMRSTAKFVQPELGCGLWVEPHRPATCGVGAAGIGF